MRKIISGFSVLILAILSQGLHAQQSLSFVTNIKTVEVRVNGEWGEAPVMLMGGSNYVEISFDDLQHNYVRYTYRITHCNADWTPSDIYEGDYLEGMNGAERIEDYLQSMNTEMEYNHYMLTLPNEEIRLKLSGNYRVDILEDGDDDPVAQACFSILESRVGIEAETSGNTDIDTYESHQQVSFYINYPNYSVTNPEQEFKPVVLQNHRWDTRVTDLVPTFIKTNQLQYTHNRRLIFPAGNEYRRFEILDKYVPTMRVDSMRYEKPYYHAYLVPDKIRDQYLFDKDQDGRFYVRNGNNVDNESESDYFFVHFTLYSPQLPGGNVYLNGDLAENSFDEMYRMDYNLMDHRYELSLPLKQGSYNYQYLLVKDDEEEDPALWTLDSGHTSLQYTEGNFHQTENEYYIYVYHRPFGERYDKLVGFKTFTHDAH